MSFSTFFPSSCTEQLQCEKSYVRHYPVNTSFWGISIKIVQQFKNLNVDYPSQRRLSSSCVWRAWPEAALIPGNKMESHLWKLWALDGRFNCLKRGVPREMCWVSLISCLPSTSQSHSSSQHLLSYRCARQFGQLSGVWDTTLLFRNGQQLQYKMDRTIWKKIRNCRVMHLSPGETGEVSERNLHICTRLKNVKLAGTLGSDALPL